MSRESQTTEKTETIKAVRVFYFESQENYEERSVDVFSEGFGPENVDKYLTIFESSCTSKEQAERYGKWFLATNKVEITIESEK